MSVVQLNTQANTFTSKWLLITKRQANHASTNKHIARIAAHGEGYTKNHAMKKNPMVMRTRARWGYTEGLIGLTYGNIPSCVTTKGQN